MSRRSQMFAEGVQKFSWALKKATDGTYEAHCLNYPTIVGKGDDEQRALIDGRTKITEAAEKAELGTTPRT